MARSAAAAAELMTARAFRRSAVLRWAAPLGHCEPAAERPKSLACPSALPSRPQLAPRQSAEWMAVVGPSRQTAAVRSPAAPWKLVEQLVTAQALPPPAVP